MFKRYTWVLSLVGALWKSLWNSLWKSLFVLSTACGLFVLVWSAAIYFPESGSVDESQPEDVVRSQPLGIVLEAEAPCCEAANEDLLEAKVVLKTAELILRLKEHDMEPDGDKKGLAMESRP